MQQLTRQTDQCVKCGMCLPHCPTYRLTRQEGHSPRGRIALVQALVSGTVQPDQAWPYLEGCVACRKCEQVCPSGVDFADLMDTARQEFFPVTMQSSWMLRKILRLLSSRHSQRFWYRMLWLGKTLGLLPLLRHFSGQGKWRMRRMIDMLPDIHYLVELSDTKRTQTTKSSQVALFVGCTGSTLGQASLQAAVHCLENLGYGVSLIQNPVCCGLAARHAGDQTGAERLRNQLVDYLNDHEGTILSLVSACSLSLQELVQEHGLLEQANVMDLGAFLLKHSNLLRERLKNSSGSTLQVALHRPCSARFCGDDSWLQTFNSLSGIELTEVGQTGCCGAGGLQFLTDHPFSDTLADELLDHLDSNDCSILLTHNMGCELHLRAHMKAAGRRIRVMHPIEFLDECMR